MNRKKQLKEIKKILFDDYGILGEYGILIHLLQIICWKHQDLHDMNLVQNTAEQIKELRETFKSFEKR